MKLKQCCRTCMYLCPQLEDDGWYDYEETYIPNYHSVNCNYSGSVDVDEKNSCEYYESIDSHQIHDGGIL